MRGLRITGILFLLGSLATAAGAQQRLVVDVNLTTLGVSVQGADGTAIQGLTQDDFEIVERGEAREALHFGIEAQPLAIGLLVDRSISIEPAKKRIDEAVGFLLEASNFADQVFLMTFAGGSDLRVTPTTDRGNILKAIRKVKLGYGTRFYDAVAEGLKYLSGSLAERKVLVVLSDGADHYSSRTFDQILDLAQRLGVTVHVLGYVGEDPTTWTAAGRQQIRCEFEKLAGTTGGLAVFPGGSAESLRTARRILDMSRYEYRFSFYASDRFTNLSDVQVRLRGNRSDELFVRMSPSAIPVSDAH